MSKNFNNVQKTFGIMASITSIVFLGVLIGGAIKKVLIDGMYTARNTDFVALSVALAALMILSGLLLYLGKNNEKAENSERHSEKFKFDTKILCCMFGAITAISSLIWFPIFLPKMLEQLSNNKIIEGLPLVALVASVFFSVMFFALAIDFEKKEKKVEEKIELNVKNLVVHAAKKDEQGENKVALFGVLVLTTMEPSNKVVVLCQECHAERRVDGPHATAYQR